MAKNFSGNEPSRDDDVPTVKLLVKVQERILQQYVVESDPGETLEHFTARVEDMAGDFPPPFADSILLEVEVVSIEPHA